eukprot:365607-Chlamydomonas_euryale.AAC.3
MRRRALQHSCCCGGNRPPGRDNSHRVAGRGHIYGQLLRMFPRKVETVMSRTAGCKIAPGTLKFRDRNLPMRLACCWCPTLSAFGGVAVAVARLGSRPYCVRS